MNKKLITGGCFGVLIALGFVCPQLAQLRVHGVLGPAGVLLLTFGLAGTIGGMWCIVKGVTHRTSTPSS